MNFEQLKADMEAGTQGDAWVIGNRGASIYIKGNGKPYKYAERVGGAVYDYDSGTDLEFSDADLDRICRVPQLERIALAAEVLEEAMHAIKFMYGTNPSDACADMPEADYLRFYLGNVRTHAKDALAAYREATQ